MPLEVATPNLLQQSKPSLQSSWPCKSIILSPLSLERFKIYSNRPHSSHIMSRLVHVDDTHRTAYGCLSCGKVYTAPHHLSNHQGKCRVTKRRLALLLEETRDHWEKRKRVRLDETREHQVSSQDTDPAQLASASEGGPILPVPVLLDRPYETRADRYSPTRLLPNPCQQTLSRLRALAVIMR